MLGQHDGPLSIAGAHGDYVVMRTDVYENMLGLTDDDESATLAAVRRGLADLEAGRTQPLDEAMKGLRSRYES